MKRIIFLAILMLAVVFTQAQHRNNKKEAKKTSEAATHLKLFPTEADKYVNIYVEFVNPTDVQITLLGSEKNNEKSWEVKAVTSHQQSLDVTALPAGTYTILLIAGQVQQKAEFNIRR